MSVRAWSPWGLLPEYPRSLLIWGGVAHQPVAVVVAIPAQRRQHRGAGEGAELIRVDGGQAALHFVNHADVRIANALTYFGDSACRKRDFADVFRLGIWPLQSFDDLAQGRRVPLLMKFYLDARLRLRDRIMQESAGQPARASMN
jgi:hypothetical protein